MEFNIEVRKKQLQSLKQYISSSEDNVHAILQSLGWTAKKTVEVEDPKITCSVSKTHLISFKTSLEHIEKCKLHIRGYKSDDEFLSEPVHCDSKSSIKLDPKAKVDVLNLARSSNVTFRSVWNGQESDPMTSDRLMSTFSTDERLALYDYCVKHTETPKKPQEFILDLPESKNTKELTEKEKLSLERDAKRRRVKYKSVHTSKKSHTEVIREVINNQMDLYAQWIEQKQKQERREKEKQKKKEKQDRESHNQNDNQYHYIETTYQNQMQNVSQWDHVAGNQYTEAYGNQYYGQIPTSDAVITDWSHAYQGVVDTNINIDSSQFNCDVNNYLEPPASSEPAQTYSTNLEMPPHPYNGYCNSYSQNGNMTENKEQTYSYSNQDYIKKQESYQKTKSGRDKSRDRDRRHDRERKRHAPSERKYDRQRRK